MVLYAEQIFSVYYVQLQKGGKVKPNRRDGNNQSGYSPIVPAVDQAGKILLCLGRGGRSRWTLTEICREVGIYKSKGYSILTTLMQFGFVEKDPQSKTYSLGPGLLSLSRFVLDHMDIRERALPFLEEIAVETRNTALLGLISAGQVFVVAKHEGNQDIGVTIRLGHRFHLTAGAHGKAIVAFMPEEERKKVLARKRLFFYGRSEPVDMGRLKEELALCREEGYAKDAGGLQPGINAVSSPVFGPHDRIIGCLILMGTFPVEQMDEKGSRAAETAARISEALGADADRLSLKGPGKGI